MVTQRHVWTRPKLPERNAGGGLLISIGMIAVGVVVIMWGVGADSIEAAAFGIPLGSALTSIGFACALVCAILREIRLMAFEAALRAGEVQMVDVKDPYIEHLNKAKL